MLINLISCPRNISTAFMYSFAQRQDVQVVDEPFYGYYLSQTDAGHPGIEQVIQVQAGSVDKIMEELNNKDDEHPIVFIKNMAHHLDKVNDDILGRMRNIFLIRNPREMLPSFVKKLPKASLQDTAYRQQYRLFRYVTYSLQQPPLVIDAAELLKNPPGILSKACEKLEIKFDETMLSWQKGGIPEDGVWAADWYESVHNSTGFRPYLPSRKSLPEELEPLQEKCQTYYKRMYKHAFKASV